MPNWARSSIHATGDPVAASRFVDDFMQAYDDGLWGDEGASKMAGVFTTATSSLGGGPRGCWWAQRGKPSGKKMDFEDSAVTFAGKWVCCYTLDEFYDICTNYPTLTFTLDTAEQGMDIKERYIGTVGSIRGHTKEEMRKIAKEKGFKALLANSG